jgi:hypothetical protein
MLYVWYATSTVSTSQLKGTLCGKAGRAFNHVVRPVWFEK